MTKKQARQEVMARGYTQLDGYGESGDSGYGSREYYSRPLSPLNAFGVPLEMATVSKVQGYGWLTSYFGDDA